MPPESVVCIGRNSIDSYYKCKNSFNIGEKILLERLGSFFGGMIPNTAVIMSTLGVYTILFDTIGEDEQTRPLLENLESAGVDTRFIHIDKQYQTPRNEIILTDVSGHATSTIFIKDEPRCPYIISREERICLEQAHYIYSTTRDLDSLENMDISRLCDKHGPKLVLDVEDIELSTFKEDVKYLRLANIIIFNKSGYQKLANEYGTDIFNDLKGSHPDKLIILTKGGSGCSVHHLGTVLDIPGILINTVDCTGAGDTFNAVMMNHLLQGKTPRESAALANKAAAESTTIIGPRSYLEILKKNRYLIGP